MTPDTSQVTALKIKKTFEAKVRKGLKKSAYEAKPAPLFVGFSGGADSTALLLSLKSVFPESQPLCAVHVEHGLRGALSRKDAEHAERVCRRYDIDFRCERVRVSQIAQWGLEGAARESRRSAFLSVAGDMGADTLALAHNKDDQAETVLMRLFEGAGVKGISGIKWRTPLSSKRVDGLQVIRPLLDTSRAEILEYLEVLGISWVEDETNEDESRLRNRIRKKIMPVVREYLGDAAISGIAKSAEISAPLVSLVDEMTMDACAEFIREDGGNISVFPLRKVRKLSQALRAGVWRTALDTLREESPVRACRRALRKWIEDLDDLALGDNPSGVLSLPGGLEARREYDRLIFGHPDFDSRLLEEQKLRIPGETVHRSLGLEMETSLDFAHPLKGAWEVCLDMEKLGTDARIRTRRDGDRFHPVGRKKEKKLKDYLIEQKIPKSLRNRIPLLAVGEKVAWIIGHQVSAEFTLVGNAKKGVILKALPGNEDSKLWGSLGR